MLGFVCTILSCMRNFIYDFFNYMVQYRITLFLIAALVAIVIIVNVNSASKLCNGICCNSASNNNNPFCDDSDDHAEQTVCCQEEEPLSNCGLVARSSSSGRQEGSQCPPSHFDYSFDHGPHTWRAAKNNQSPINIVKDCAEVQMMSNSLKFLHFDDIPSAIQLENNGRTFKLRACYCDAPPTIAGGELLSGYKFIEMSFRWSLYDSEGSEHTIDNVHYPLELQALYFAGDVQKCGSSYQQLMLSYLYDIAAENPFLDVVIPYLVCIQEPGTFIEIPPFPLSYLMPPFGSHFYSYDGSQTEPPCQRGVEWYINPEPLAIGPRQMNELRQLRGCNGTRIKCNSRPVQPLGKRIVFLNEDVNLDGCDTKSNLRLKRPSSSSSSYCCCSSSRSSSRK